MLSAGLRVASQLGSPHLASRRPEGAGIPEGLLGAFWDAGNGITSRHCAPLRSKTQHSAPQLASPIFSNRRTR